MASQSNTRLKFQMEKRESVTMITKIEMITTEKEVVEEAVEEAVEAEVVDMVVGAKAMVMMSKMKASKLSKTKMLREEITEDNNAISKTKTVMTQPKVLLISQEEAIEVAEKEEEVTSSETMNDHLLIQLIQFFNFTFKDQTYTYITYYSFLVKFMSKKSFPYVYT